MVKKYPPLKVYSNPTTNTALQIIQKNLCQKIVKKQIYNMKSNNIYVFPSVISINAVILHYYY